MYEICVSHSSGGVGIDYGDSCVSMCLETGSSLKQNVTGLQNVERWTNFTR